MILTEDRQQLPLKVFYEDINFTLKKYNFNLYRFVPFFLVRREIPKLYKISHKRKDFLITRNSLDPVERIPARRHSLLGDSRQPVGKLAKLDILDRRAMRAE